MNELKKAGIDLAEILQSLTEEEKKQAYAMLSGMIIGRELAEQQPKSA